MSNPSKQQQSCTSKVSRTNMYLDQQYVDHSYIDYANEKRDDLCVMKGAALLRNDRNSSGLDGPTRAKPSTISERCNSVLPFPYKVSAPHHMIWTSIYKCSSSACYVHIICIDSNSDTSHSFFIVHSFTRYSIEMIYQPSSIGCPTVELWLSNGPRP